MAPKSNVSNASSVAGGTTGSDLASTRTATLQQKDPAGKYKQTSNHWKDLQDALQKVSKNAYVYADMDEAVKEHCVTQNILAEKIAELSDRDTHISVLETRAQSLLEGFEARYKKWNNDTTELKRRSEREKTRSEATHKREIETMEAKLKSLQEQIASLSTGLAQANQDADYARRECDINKHRLLEWDGYLSELKDIDIEDL